MCDVILAGPCYSMRVCLRSAQEYNEQRCCVECRFVWRAFPVGHIANCEGMFCLHCVPSSAIRVYLGGMGLQAAGCRFCTTDRVWYSTRSVFIRLLIHGMAKGFLIQWVPVQWVGRDAACAAAGDLSVTTPGIQQWISSGCGLLSQHSRRVESTEFSHT